MKTTKMLLLFCFLLMGPVILNAQDLEPGEYYALIIGIDNYSGNWRPMSNSVLDAETIKTTLEEHYKFDHFKTLYNEEASRENIYKAFEWLMSAVKENDNVLIYFTGHGEYDTTLNAGCWVPVDAQSNSVSGLISNADIHSFIFGIKSRHTLLISDAAFSGDIFRGNVIQKEFEDSQNYYEMVHKLPSRKAITSGGIEPDVKNGSVRHSVFAYFLINALSDNEDRYYDATQLFNQIKIPITNNSEISPRFAPLKGTGDAGGQFVFIRKED